MCIKDHSTLFHVATDKYILIQGAKLEPFNQFLPSAMSLNLSENNN